MIKMFIADDEQIVVEGIRDSINWAEYGVEVCGTASNGLDALKQSIILMPDIIISDIKMPGLNGLEFVKELKTRIPKSLIILISAYQKFEYAKEAIKLGVLSYITKPFKKNQILEEVLKACDVIKEEEHKLELNSKFEQELPTLRSYFLNSIILGDDIQLEEYEENVEKYRLDLSKRNVRVLVIRPELPEETLPERSKSIKDICGSIQLSILKNLPNELKITTFFSPGNDVVVIYGAEDINILDFSEINNGLKKVKANIYDKLGILISIGIGRLYFDYKNIYLSYKEAMSALNYKLIYGDGSIIFIDNIVSESSDTVKVVVCINKKIECFENLLSVGNCEESLKKAREIALYMKENKGVSYNYVQQVFAQLLSLIVRRAIELNIYDEILSKDITGLYEKVYAMKSLAELSDFLGEIIKEVCEVTERKTLEMSSGTINKALEFMKQHCHENIAQTNVAEYVGLNASYFSRYFKEETGQSFMDYMKKLRIDKAKELMISSNMKIYEISEALGYQSVQYFSTLFKSLVGLTPQEYKDKKQLS